jgi:hypothetical protein
VQLRVAEQYVGEFGKLAKTTNTVILPATLSDVGSMIALAMNVLRTAGKDGDAVRSTVLAGARPAQPAPGGAPRPPPTRPLPGT